MHRVALAELKMNMLNNLRYPAENRTGPEFLLSLKKKKPFLDIVYLSSSQYSA